MLFIAVFGGKCRQFSQKEIAKQSRFCNNFGNKEDMHARDNDACLPNKRGGVFCLEGFTGAFWGIQAHNKTEDFVGVFTRLFYPDALFVHSFYNWPELGFFELNVSVFCQVVCLHVAPAFNPGDGVAVQLLQKGFCSTPQWVKFFVADFPPLGYLVDYKKAIAENFKVLDTFLQSPLQAFYQRCVFGNVVGAIFLCYSTFLNGLIGFGKVKDIAVSSYSPRVFRQAGTIKIKLSFFSRLNAPL